MSFEKGSYIRNSQKLSAEQKIELNIKISEILEYMNISDSFNTYAKKYADIYDFSKLKDLNACFYNFIIEYRWNMSENHQEVRVLMTQALIVKWLMDTSWSSFISNLFAYVTGTDEEKRIIKDEISAARQEKDQIYRKALEDTKRSINNSL